MSPDPTRDASEAGVVLMLVLVIIVLSISLVYALTKTTTLDVISMRQREHLVRAQILARSGLAIAERALLDDVIDSDPLAAAVDGVDDAWTLLSRTPIDLGDGGELRVRVRDAASKIGLNALLGPEGERIEERSREFLVEALGTIVENTPELARSPLANDERRGDLADAILDWIDSDDETRIGTPEESFYATRDGKPLDRPILSIDELAAVPDMDPLLLDVLAAYFSPYPLHPTEGDGGGVNPNTAPPHVLSLLYTGNEVGMQLVSEDDVFRILDLREEGKYFCPGEDAGEDCLSLGQELRREGEQAFPPLQYQSQVFRVDVEARFGEARSCVSAVIDRAYPEGPATLIRRLGC
jgi:type II secretory pathway component PulK